MSTDVENSNLTKAWPSYRTVWRWHFYAGLFCIPFVIWLGLTGSIYLFRPQIEAWLDSPYDHLSIKGPRAQGDAEILTALRAVPGSNLHYYELPRTAQSAVRVIVGKGTEEFRVYIHPQTLSILKIVNEDHRPMTVIFHLHGELLMGDRGSFIVELAASWAIVMILTGLYLWWPRERVGLGGVLYPRFRQGGRIFWRDLHAVTGIWVSVFVLFLLFTGLPWAKSWGTYLEKIRELTHTESNPDWTVGRSGEIAARLALNEPGVPLTSSEHAAHAGHMSTGTTTASYAAIDKMIANVAPLNLAYPVLISPPVAPGQPWTAKADPQNRTLGVNLALDPSTGRIIKRENFDQRQWIDRAVEIGVAAHEGQLFGLANQLLGLFTGLGVVTLSVSSLVLWWRRRPEKVLGAPAALQRKPHRTTFLLIVVALAVYLPLLGISLIAVRLIEAFVLRRIPLTRNWLGLAGA